MTQVRIAETEKYAHVTFFFNGGVEEPNKGEDRMLKHISDTYEIIEKIGAGNSGEVYKAYHKNLKKYVVLKKIRAEIKDVLNNRAEADVLKNLHHLSAPGI